MSAAPRATLVRDLDGMISSWSAGATALLGYAADEILGTPAARLVPEENPARPVGSGPASGNGRQDGPYRALRLCKDGRAAPVWVTESPIHDRDGQIIAVAEVLVPDDGAASVEHPPLPDSGEMAAAVDRLIDSALAESETRLRLALQAARMGVWEWVIPTGQVYWSRECYDIVGTRDFDGTFEGFRSRVHPEDRERVQATVEAAIDGRRDLHHEFRVLLPDGRVRWLENLARVFCDASGTPVRMVGTVENITARKEAAEHLRRQEERLSLALTVTHTGVWEWDITTHAVVWSPECYAIVGLRPDQFDGTLEGFERMIHPEDAEEVAARSADAVGRREQFRLEFRIIRPDGQVRWIENVARAQYDATGVPRRMLGTVRDVTEDHELREQLKESGASFRQLAEGLPHITWTTGPDGTEHYMSPQGLAYHGVSAEELKRRWPELIHPDDREALLAARKVGLETGRPYEAEARLLRHDGTFRWHEVRAAPVRGTGGEIIRWVGSLTDVEQAHELRERLQAQEERLTKLAEVSPSAIHSFRRPPEGPGYYAYASPVLSRILGVPLEVLQRDASPTLDRVDPTDREGLLAAVASSQRDHTPLHYGCRYHHPDGRELWIEVFSTPVQEPDGGTIWHGVLEDATERRRSEEQLRTSEERVQAVLENLGEAVVVSDLEGRLISWNRTALRMHGFEQAEEWLRRVPEFKDSFELRTLEGRVLPLDEWPATRILRGERLEGVELQVRRLDIPWERVFSYGGAIVELPSGGRVATITISDISARVATERELRQWADAFEHCAHGIAVGLPGQNVVLACNPAFAQLLGRAVGEVTGTPIAELYDPADRERVRRLTAEADRNGQCRYEARMRRADGSGFDVQVDVVSVRGADGAARYRIATVQDISQRKAAAESLRGMSDWLQAIVRASPLPIVALDADGDVLLWNIAAQELFGWSAEEVLGQPLPIVPKDGEEQYREMRQRVIAGRPFRNLITQRMTRDRRRVDVSISTAPLHDRKGRVMGLVASYVDLTELRGLRDALNASEQRFTAAFQASPSGSILLRGSDRTIVEVNQVLCDLSGYTREEILGRTTQEVGDFIPRAMHEALWHRLDTERRLVQIDYPYRRKDGTPRHALVSAERMVVAGEDLVLGVFVDVTDRRRAEQALRESEERMRLFIEHAPAALAMFDREMRYLSASHRWVADYHLGSTELRGRSHYEIFPEIPERWREIHRRALAGEVIRADTDRFERQDGTVQLLRWEVRPWHDASGQVGGILIFAEDITASLEAQEALSRSEGRFRQLAESIREVFWLSDVAKGKILYVSPAYDAIWGRPGEALYDSPQDWLAAIHPDDRDRVLEAALTRQVAGTYDEEYRIVRPDGSVRWIRDQAFPVRNASGVVERVAGVAEDITERRLLEGQLRQTQKMESIGLLAGGVAHDFNNWLTVIAGNAELLQDDLPAGSDNQALVAEIIHAGERATALTRQLLAFSRREVVEPQVLDLNSVIVETEKMLGRLLGEDILLTSALSPGLPPVRVDPGQWTQVILNLAVNARDAMPAGGQLTLETRTIEVDEEFRRTHPGLAAGRHVVLSLSDTGTGMSPEVRSRIFEPFFTTKARGKGTGLGLAVVHGIVNQSGGSVEVYSEPGLGTTFKLYIPVVQAGVAAAAAHQEVQETRGSETILLVEDEESVRRVARLALEPQGYTVLPAANGVEALRAAEQHRGRIHLLLTDVVLPHMDGRQLAEALIARDPELRVLYTSGYTDDAVVRHGILQAEVTFLSKPYTPLSLVRKVRQTLDRK